MSTQIRICHTIDVACQLLIIKIFIKYKCSIEIFH